MIIGVPQEIKPRRAARRADARRRPRPRRPRPPRARRAGGRGRQRLPRRGVHAARARASSRSTRCGREAELILKVKEPIPAGVPAAPRGPDPLHLPPPGGRARAHARAPESGTIAIAYETVQRADGSLPLLTPMSEVAGRLAVQEGAFYLGKAHGGRGILLSGVPGVPPGNVVILGAGTVGLNAAQDRGGPGRRRVDPRRQPRSAAPRGRPLPRPGRHAGLERLQHRPPAPSAPTSWSARVLVAGARAPVLVPDADGGDDEGGLGDRRRGGRPGRLRRDDAPDDARRADLPRARRRPLRRGQHARPGAPHVDLRADQRHPALRRRAGRARAWRRRCARTRRWRRGSTSAGAGSSTPAWPSRSARPPPRWRAASPEA